MLATNRRLAAIAAAGAAVATIATGAPAAHADNTPYGASGNSTFQFNSQFTKALQANGCGALTAAPTGNATIQNLPKGKFRVVLPITGLAWNSENTHFRIIHNGSGVALSNSCWDVRFTNVYIQDLGQGDDEMGWDVSAKKKSADGTERDDLFTLDLSTAQASLLKNSNGVKVYGMNVDLAEDGVADFNQVATGDPETGPFTVGLQVGKAKTTVRYTYTVA